MSVEGREKGSSTKISCVYVRVLLVCLFSSSFVDPPPREDFLSLPSSSLLAFFSKRRVCDIHTLACAFLTFCLPAHSLYFISRSLVFTNVCARLYTIWISLSLSLTYTHIYINNIHINHYPPSPPSFPSPSYPFLIPSHPLPPTHTHTHKT